MKEVVVYGKTVEDALQSFLLANEMSPEEVKYEVIEDGKGSFFSKKQASIKVFWEENRALTAFAFVKDGEIITQFDEPKPITITPCEKIFLYINGEHIESEQSFTAIESIEIVENIENLKRPDWEIRFNENRTVVRLLMSPGVNRRFRLKDCAATNKLVLQTYERVEHFNDADEQAIFDRLMELGIKLPIKKEVIAEACQSLEALDVVIVEGRPPVEGQDGYLDVLIDLQGKTTGENRQQRVNFREMKMIPQAKEGETIAVVYDATPGQPGIDVFGELIPPKEPTPIQVVIGTGIRQIGTTIMAEVSGRPAFESKQNVTKVSIVQKLTHQEDVSLASGNIRFSGDVEVMKDVREGMVVQGLGVVHIRGLVQQATILGKKAVIIDRNLIASEVIVGDKDERNAALTALVVKIGQSLKNLIDLLVAFMKTPAYTQSAISSTRFHSVVLMLIDHRVPELKKNAKLLVDFVTTHKDFIEMEWLELSSMLQRKFFILSSEDFRSIDDLFSFAEMVDQWVMYHQEESQLDSFARVNYVQNSHIVSNGDVFIEGKGAVSTRIEAQGSIHVKGIVRGGEFHAGANIHIQEAGSESGVVVELFVPKTGKIHMAKVFPGTVVHVGSKRHVFMKQLTNIQVYINHDDVLVY